MSPTNVVQRPSETKIVATVGPACEDPGKLAELITAGVDVFRINTAHGDRQEHARRVADIRAAAKATGHVIGILVDLAGPKIRLGELPGGQMECTSGGTVRFVSGSESRQADELTTTYAPLIDELAVGDHVVLADGIVSLIVESKGAGGAMCRILQGGTLRSRQGVNLPGVRLSVEPLGPRDRDNAIWAAREGIDFVSLSFVRTADEVRKLKALIEAEGSAAQVIAKIEKPEAVLNIESIIEAADGIMVARGDLGVETDIAQVPIIQKRIIAACNRHRKPVIVATQMLDSMQQSRIPTRAEATDVANAVLDGADACMLSGETAIGRYPREAVETMHRIAVATEPMARLAVKRELADLLAEDINPITEATTLAAGRLAETLNAQLIVVASASGKTALSVAKNRHFVPTVGISDSEAVLRRMTLYWGIIPLAGAPPTIIRLCSTSLSSGVSP